MRARRSGPVMTEELEDLFGALLGAHERVILAVSGGCDSTALMVLFADWLAARIETPATHTVLTIDHRLRPQSAGEALSVARQAAALGYQHQTLVWEGDKPTTGLQVAARAARYRLIGAYALSAGIGAMMTGHTADDQAETLLMRLARGSGLDGLAAMVPASRLCLDADAAASARVAPPPSRRPAGCAPSPPDAVPEPASEPASEPATAIRLLRPFLVLAKARLRATLEARAIAWQEDPSNRSPAFERTRVRAASAAFAALGMTQDRLALSARRLQRARVALERAVDAFCAPQRGHVIIDPCGFIRIDGPALRAQPLEIAIRLLNRAVAQTGGAGQPVPLAKLEAVAAGIFARERGAWTLARAKMTATRTAVLIEREPGRTPPHRLVLAPGQQAVWDGRFLVRAGQEFAGAVEVCALGVEGLREVAKAVAISRAAPAGALRLLPAFSRDGRLLAAPNLGYWAAPPLSASLAAAFAPICSCNTSFPTPCAGADWP